MPAHGTVVITGASTGIGRATALRLARGGFEVLAGVRREEDGAALRSRGRPHRAGTRRRDGRRAGRGPGRARGRRPAGRARQQRRHRRRRTAGGHPARRRAPPVRGQRLRAAGRDPGAAQSIRAGHGRIVNIGSIGGRINTPFVAPYSSSKAAVRSLSAALRRELRPWDIRVALVEPGALDTPIWRKGEEGATRRSRALPEHVRTLYARQLDALVAATRTIAAGASSPDDAARPSSTRSPRSARRRSTPSGAGPASRARCTRCCPRVRSTRLWRGR